jgi:hypothetical protein
MQSRRRFGRNVLLAASALGLRNIALHAAEVRSLVGLAD